jgi:transcription elongation factor GreB
LSRAFVKEQDGDDIAEDLPLRIHSEEPNYITRSGEIALREKLQTIISERESLNLDADHLGKAGELQRLDADISYFRERLQRAIIVEPHAPPFEHVMFGATVTLLSDSGIKHEFTIVGEDETDVDSGRISWTSALGSALLQEKLGESIIWKRPEGDLELEIIAIEYR